jgi:hypothetical protein
VVRALLAAGAEIDADRTLFDAAFNGHPEVARVLLGAGADTDARGGGSSYTPLRWAIRWGHDVHNKYKQSCS